MDSNKFTIKIKLYVNSDKESACDAVEDALVKAGIDPNSMTEDFWNNAKYIGYEILIEGTINETGKFTHTGTKI